MIVQTAQTDITKLEEALAEGAHDYITKPCEPTELRARIRGAFSLPQQQFWMGLSAFLDAFSTRGHRPDDITYLCLESKV